MRAYRFYLAAQLAGWAAFVVLAFLSGGPAMRAIGLGGDSGSWLLLFVLVPLLAGLPAWLPPLFRALGRVRIGALALAPLPLLTSLGVFFRLGLHAAGSAGPGWLDGVSWAMLMAAVATSPLLFLAPLVAALARLRTQPSPHPR